MSPRTDWRYRFGPMKEREQKRLYATDDDPTASLPWVYYLLSGNKQQLAVYNGIEGRPCGGAIGNVYMWPVEYNAYGVGGGRVITRPNNSKMFVVTDHLGSVRLTYNAQGDVQETADYEPFGAVLVKAGEEARTGYIGRETDNESNLGFNGVRLYDQQYGRFLSTDKLWEKYAALQPYSYVAGNPLSNTDGDGLEINPKNLTNDEKDGIRCGIETLRSYGSPVIDNVLDKAEGAGSRIDLWSLESGGTETALSEIHAGDQHHAGKDLQSTMDDRSMSLGLTIPTNEGGDMVADIILDKGQLNKLVTGADDQGIALVALLDELNHGTSTLPSGNGSGTKMEADHSALFNGLMKEIRSEKTQTFSPAARALIELKSSGAGD